MERKPNRKRDALIAITLSAAALAGCSVDSYLTNLSNVRCDGRRTEAELGQKGFGTFIVHGKTKGDVATVRVRRDQTGASVSVGGDVTGPQQAEADGFSTPTAVVDGPELSAMAAGGAWVIDVRKETVVIQGSCDGL